MAATIAKAIGYDSTRVKETHRLGSQGSWAQAATWRTFAEAGIERDGSGYIKVVRDGKTIHSFYFEKEDES
jgi:hypothetical protein